MARRSKDYRVQLAPPILTGGSAELCVRFADAHGDAGRVFDFRQFPPRAMVPQLALAFRHYCADKRPASQATSFGSIISWFRFLDDTASPLGTVREVDGLVIRAFIAWLDKTAASKATRHSTYGQIKRLLSWLHRNRPDLIHPGLEYPYNPFPRPQSDCMPRESLSRAEIEAVLSAARKEIESNWKTI